jgi:predicted nucleic acid-binding protein
VIVVDASLAVKWLVLEADTPLARAFLRRHFNELAAPELLISEVGGAIVRHANMGVLTPSQASQMLREWTSFWREETIDGHRLSAELVSSAASIAMNIGHALPDCIYLALALELDCDLATCDAKFQAKTSPHFPQVRLLAHFDA